MKNESSNTISSSSENQSKSLTIQPPSQTTAFDVAHAKYRRLLLSQPLSLQHHDPLDNNRNNKQNLLSCPLTNENEEIEDKLIEQWIDFGYHDENDDFDCTILDDEEDRRDPRIHRVRLSPPPHSFRGDGDVSGTAEWVTKTKRKVFDNEDDCNSNDLIYRGPVYTLPGRPGFLLAPHAISRPLQDILAYKAMTEYCESPPHKTNIDLIPPRPSEVVVVPPSTQQPISPVSGLMWALWKQENGFMSIGIHKNKGKKDHQPKKQRYQPQQSENLSITAITTAPDHIHPVDAIPQHRQESKSSIPQRAPTLPYRLPQISSNQRYYRSFRKLSWATMGYHYDWTTRCYNKLNQSPIPDEITKLGTLFARLSLWLEANVDPYNNERDDTRRQQDCNLSSLSSSSYNCPPLEMNKDYYSYTASACIVNYYHSKSTMGGHRDDLELALDKPIVSISLGSPALFLLGGSQKDDSLIYPIVVRPGDVMIMGGPSRLNYHSMVRLLPELSPTAADSSLYQHSNLRHEQRSNTSAVTGTQAICGSATPTVATADASPCHDAASRNKATSTAALSYQVTPNQIGLSLSMFDGEVTVFDEQHECERSAVRAYLSTHRININIRQVYSIE